MYLIGKYLQLIRIRYLPTYMYMQQVAIKMIKMSKYLMTYVTY